MKLLLAFVIDVLVGDPEKLPHPVVGIGKLIEKLNGLLLKSKSSSRVKKINGVILLVGVVTTVMLITKALIVATTYIHPLLGYWIEVLIISTTIASKSLAKAGREIGQLLAQGDILEARRKVGWIVGRDTDKLDESEITRATIETVAENIVDGIVSPLFFALLGGGVLAMGYKAVNTLDSMVGYKNEKYFDYGWASAKFDDVLNYLPARFTALFVLVSGLLLGLAFSQGIKSVLRDANKHPSPNGGYPEASVAGLLGITLGGNNFYGGIASYRAEMGLEKRRLTRLDIATTIKIMWLSSWLAMIAFSIIRLLVEGAI